MKLLLNGIMGLVGLLAFVGVVYGMYYVGKAVSYNIFYESMVVDSINEHVKEKCINR